MSDFQFGVLVAALFGIALDVRSLKRAVKDAKVFSECRTAGQSTHVAAVMHIMVDSKRPIVPHPPPARGIPDTTGHRHGSSVSMVVASPFVRPPSTS